MPFQVEPTGLSPEQLEFREVLRRFFEEAAPVAEARSLIDAPGSVSRALWKRCCEELALPGLAIPEALGGQGFGLLELGLAIAEAGRGLAPIPLLASAGLAGRALARVGDADAWLREIAAGRIATLAFQERGTDGSLDATRTEAVPDGDGFRLRGEKHFVLDALDAERIFVVARLAGSTGRAGLGLFAVEREAEGLEVAALRSLDVTRPLHAVQLDAAPARAVGTPGEQAATLEAALDEATALLCAEMVGGMECVLETAVAYAGSRFQFGRAIGSFQAIKHKCADMLIDFEGARTAAAAALAAHEEHDAERVVLTSVAKAHTSAAYVRTTRENVQIHGGVGYTWEYDAHLYFRRAAACAQLLGDPAAHNERLAGALAAELPA